MAGNSNAVIRPGEWVSRPRRGVALLLAIFALAVVGTTTVAYVTSREGSAMVARNAQVAADSRSLAASALDLTAQILRNPDSNWRTAHTNGRLLSNYSLDGGTVTVDLVDIERRDAGMANPVPASSTTEVEVTVTTTRNGSTWTSVADMSIPSVLRGQYAIYANRILSVNGSANFIGRWTNAPASAQNLRVNLGCGALSSSTNGSQPWLGYGVWLQGGCQFESVVDGFDPSDPDTALSTWVYYPYAASNSQVQGDAANLVADRRMDQDESAQLMTTPSAPSVSSPYTNYTTAQVLNAQTVTYNQAFRIRATFLPQLFTRNFEVRNNSTVTLTSGTYEIWGSWILRDSRIIISGNVRVVVNPNLALTGLDWQNSSVELNANSTLEIYNGYSMDMRNCWIGSRYICTSEPNAAIRDGDPHRKVWNNTWQPTDCHPQTPTEPLYIEPWRIRFYPMSQFLSNFFMWDIRDSSVVGSLFLPSNPIRVRGASKIFGRIACNQILVEDTSSFYYDHALDEVTGLTEGTVPSRGGDPSNIFPVRVVRFGFDAENAR